MTIILKLLLICYAIASIAAAVTVVKLGDLPVYFDRSTTYGDEKLNWRERIMLLIFLPSILGIVWWEDKWPGIKRIWVELWVTIVHGRQATAADHDPVDHSHSDEAP